MLEDIGYWIIRTYLAGGVGEKTKFYVPADRGRSKRAQASELRKQEQNEGNVTRRVARMINEYFSSADYLIGLDLSPAGMERVQAGAERIRGKKPRDDYTDEDYIRLSTAHEGELFIRRLKKHLPEDTEIRYVAFASDREKNKRTGDLEPCRAHLHIVLSACGEIGAMRTLGRRISGAFIQVPGLLGAGRIPCGAGAADQGRQGLQAKPEYAAAAAKGPCFPQRGGASPAQGRHLSAARGIQGWGSAISEIPCAKKRRRARTAY